MEKLLKNELFRSFILSIVIFAVLMIGTATSVINSYWQGVLILCGINIILAVSLNLAAGYLGQLTLGHAGFMSVGAYTSALLSIYLNLPFIVSLLILDMDVPSSQFVRMKQHQNYQVLMLVIIKYLPLQSVLFLQDLQEDYMHIIIQLSFLKDLTSTNQLKF